VFPQSFQPLGRGESDEDGECRQREPEECPTRCRERAIERRTPRRSEHIIEALGLRPHPIGGDKKQNGKHIELAAMLDN
jgi:hypothetical protein